MAFVSEKMDENRINFLANEIAKTYMHGKLSGSEDFINTYLDVYEASKKIIIDREIAKNNARNNMNINDLMRADSQELNESPANKFFL